VGNGAVALSVIWGILASGCGAGNTAGNAVRPKEISAGEALKGDNAKAAECSASDDDRSLIVDLATEDRKDMENMLRQNKVPVVAYDCKSLKLLRRCSLDAKFEYLGSSPRKNVRSIENSDSIAAEVPLASASLKASINSGRKVDIALAEVGTRSSSFELVAKTELKSVGADDCNSATHFVRAVDIGAFAIAQRTSGEAAAAAAIFTASTKGDSKANVSSMNSEGKVDACDAAKESDTDAPEGCRVPLRLSLRRIVADSKEKEAKEQQAKANTKDGEPPARPDAPCPDGKVRAEGGSCVLPSPNIKYQCRFGEFDECKTQCDKGHLGSCERLGSMLLWGQPPAPPGQTAPPPKYERDPKAAIVALEKACNVKAPNVDPKGCTSLANAYSSALMPSPPKPGAAPEPMKFPTDAERKEAFDKAGTVLEFGCKHLDAASCYSLGSHFDNGLMPTVSGDADRGMHFYARACGLGYTSGCLTQARLYVEGKKKPDGSDALKKDPVQGLAVLDKACQANNTSACQQLATYLTADKYKVKDVKRAAGIFKAQCDKKDISGCAEYALLQVGGEGGVKADPKAARETLEKLCYDSNSSSACYGVGLLKETAAAGMTEDKAKALEYYKKYPYVKDSAARAAHLLDQGAKGVTKNETEAADLYGRACTATTNSDFGPCKKAAELMDKVPANVFRARSYWDSACKLGDKGSCEKAHAKLGPPPPPPGLKGAPPPPPPGPPGKGAPPPPLPPGQAKKAG
jgi:TPR repeat protein